MSDKLRQEFLDYTMANLKVSIRKSAKKFGINYENAKVIVQIYKREQRLKSIPHHARRLKPTNTPKSSKTALPATFKGFIENEEIPYDKNFKEENL